MYLPRRALSKSCSNWLRTGCVTNTKAADFQKLSFSSSQSSSWSIQAVQKREEQESKYKALGLQQYSRDVANTVGYNLAITAASGAASVGGIFALAATGKSAGLVGTALPFAMLGAAGISLYHAYQIGKVAKTDSERERHSRWMHAGMGVTLAPSLIMFPSVIPQAAVLSLALTLGPITASQLMREGAMLKYGPALHTCLWGVVGVSLTSAVAPLLGFPGLANITHDISLYGGLALFTVYNAYDFHVMVEDFKAGRMDRVGHAANYSLNVINIFLRLLEILGHANNND